ncbi:hemerythrin domain-containing protein [Kitasatospora sp. NPDC001683]
MSSSRQGMIDFTVMYATHNAFRRDLERLRSAAAAGRAGDPQVRAGWENFKTQLLIHHSVEDAELWPRLRRAVQGKPRELALTDAMEAEHADLDPLLASVDAALGGQAAALVDRVEKLVATLDDHLTHEEETALPLIQSELTVADWRGFTDGMRRRQGVKGASVYVPWVLDGRSDTERATFLSAMPAPVRVLNRLFWEGGYRKRRLWG